MLSYRVLLTFLLVISITFLFAQSSQESNADALVEEEEYEVAAKIYGELKNGLFIKKSFKDALRVLVKQGIALQNSGDDATSIQILKDGLSQIEGKVVKDSTYALAYHKLAVAYYGENNFRAAINNWKEAIRIREKIFSSSHLSIVKANRNIGTSYINLEDINSAEKYLKTALDLNVRKTVADSILLAKTYKDLGAVSLKEEDLKQAESYLLSARDLFYILYKGEPWEYARIYEQLINLYILRDDYEQMKLYANNILKDYSKMDESEYYDEDYEFIANAYSNLALSQELAKEYQKAEKSYQKSILINRKITDRDYELGNCYNNLAVLYKNTNQSEKAIKAINRAIDLYTKAQDEISRAEALDNKAEIYLSINQPQQAIQYIEEAIGIITPNDSKLVAEKPLLASLLADKVRVLQALSVKENRKENLELAAETSERIMQLFDEIRQGFQSDASKSFLSKKAKIIIAQNIQIELDLYKLDEDRKHIEKAFELSERSKSLILLDALGEAQAKKTTNVPTALVQRENRIKKSIADIEKELFAKDSETLALQNSLILLNRELEKITDTLEQNYPAYFEAKYAQSTFNLSKFQSNLEGNVLAYFMDESIIYAFVLSNESIEVTALPKSKNLSNSIRTFRESIYGGFVEGRSSQKTQRTNAKQYAASAYSLYEQLIKPVEDKIKTNEQLLIIPDGILGYIPFDALLTQKVEKGDLFGIHPYMINDYQISYCYSLALLEEMRNKVHQNSNASFIAFAPMFEEKDKSVAYNRSDLSALDYNVPEVEALNELFKGEIFKNETATEDNFNIHAPNYQLIHLATHGKANDKSGDYAYLAFTEQKDNMENEFLYNRDLYNIQLNADMVVLSACETGIGELQKGEGIISLARGFSYAGAKSIVTTLWSINDEKTKELMLNFYTQLKDGKSKDAALRQAKLNFIEKYSHNANPFFWAAFIPIGDMESIRFSSSTICVYIIGFALLLLGFLLYQKNKRNKTRT